MDESEVKPLTREDIPRRLRGLSAMMEMVAEEMRYFGGFGPWTVHANELDGAAFQVLEWAGCIEQEHATGGTHDGQTYGSKGEQDEAGIASTETETETEQQ